jgi:hypothetical protein
MRHHVILWKSKLTMEPSGMSIFAFCPFPHELVVLLVRRRSRPFPAIGMTLEPFIRSINDQNCTANQHAAQGAPPSLIINSVSMTVNNVTV